MQNKHIEILKKGYKNAKDYKNQRTHKKDCRDIYGVDLMPDNIAEAKRRMLAMIDGKCDIAEARRIIDINIQQGDFLKEQDKIVFTDWTDMSQHTLASMIKPDLFNSTKRKTNDK